MVDVLTAPQQTTAAKSNGSLRTLAAISTAHWVSHFHMFVLPMLFPFLKAKLGVGYIDLGFALTVFAVISGLTQAPIGYLADRIGARKILLMGLTLGGCALIMLGLHLSYPWLIASAALLGLANSVYHPANYAILSAHMDEARMGRAFSIHTFAGFFGGAVAPAIVAALAATIGGACGVVARHCRHPRCKRRAARRQRRGNIAAERRYTRFDGADGVLPAAQSFQRRHQ
jgi:MFS family permease